MVFEESKHSCDYSSSQTENDSLQSQTQMKDNDEVEEEYSARIARLQQEYLIPLKEDLAEWLNRILGVDDISSDNFMSKLDNGVVVCKLSKIIQEQCDANLHAAVNGKLGAVLFPDEHDDGEIADPSVYHNNNITRKKHWNGMWNSIGMKCWENAKSQSFYARDNVCNFIKWCRKFGVKDALLFETDDLVSHVNPRNVVLCLLEVARIACTKHSFSPAPGLVQLEQEIDELEKETLNCETDSGWSTSSFTHDSACSPVQNTTDHSVETIEQLDTSARTPSASSLISGSSSAGLNSSTNGSTPTKLLTSELDHKVMQIAKSYYGRQVHQGVKRLSEGKYRINGRIVFVRLLKARHVMVRVGGGWDTLQHFLERHGADPSHEISVDDLLPLDTRSTTITPRISRIYNSNNNNHNNLVSSSSTTHLASIPFPSFHRYQYQQQHQPSRCASSTPVSRRNSLSSPEPWMSGSSYCSSGYSSSSNYSPPTNNNGINNNTLTMTIPRRRRSSTETSKQRQNRASLGSSIPVPTSNSSSFSPSSFTSTTNNRSTSEPSIKCPNGSRYPNYLSSSQHITNRTTPTQSNGGNLATPITGSQINLAKQNVFRKTVQKTC